MKPASSFFDSFFQAAATMPAENLAVVSILIVSLAVIWTRSHK